MNEGKTYVFGNDNANSLATMLAPLLLQRGIDPSVLAIMNNGGFGGNSSWAIWILFIILLWGNNGYGNNNNGNLANMINNDSGRELLMNAIQGNNSAIDHLATLLNTNISNIQNALNSVMMSVSQVGNSVGLTGQQVINSIQGGNAALAQQLCKCCCDNQLAIANQTSALQQGMFSAQTALNDGITQNRFANQMGQSNLQHSIDMVSAADNLAVCQQTNTLQNGATANTQRIVDAIANLSNKMGDEFCAARERDMQSKIDSQAEEITQLRGQISNDAQNKQFADAFSSLQNQITALSSKVPNTVPVTYPNLVAVNQTPYNGGYYGNSLWG